MKTMKTYFAAQKSHIPSFNCMSCLTGFMNVNININLELQERERDLQRAEAVLATMTSRGQNYRSQVSSHYAPVQDKGRCRNCGWLETE